MLLIKVKKTISLSACHEHSTYQSNIGEISSFTVLCSRKMNPLNQNKGGSAQYYNTLPMCQENPGSYTIGSGWGVCQNWVVLSYVGNYEFGRFCSIKLTVINNIIYFKTHTTSEGRIVCLFQENHV